MNTDDLNIWKAAIGCATIVFGILAAIVALLGALGVLG